MENEHLKIIKLVQHTPMWHFQSQESGCCLRASEVKPKLDRFIAEKSGKPYAALNYKMSFKPLVRKRILKDSFFNHNGNKENLYPLYFGNIKANKKRLILYPNEEASIEMYLFSLNTNLLKEINEYINLFFACNSFGTRQDKGFGFFYPEGVVFDDSEASYFFDVPDIEGKYTELFNYIHYFHKMIRSGINEKGAYNKSFMYHYAQECGENWDKPVIRYYFQLLNPVYTYICGKGSTIPYIQDRFTVQEDMEKEYSRLDKEEKFRNSHWLFREALGLSNTQKWMAYNDTISIESTDKNIKRFKSPITYRPVPIGDGKYRIYLYLSPIDLNYKNTTFRIKNKPDSVRGYGPPKPAMTNMKIYKDFSLEKYLDFVLDYCHAGKPIGNGNNKYAEHIFQAQDGIVNFKKISKSK